MPSRISSSIKFLFDVVGNFDFVLFHRVTWFLIFNRICFDISLLWETYHVSNWLFFRLIIQCFPSTTEYMLETVVQVYRRGARIYVYLFLLYVFYYIILLLLYFLFFNTSTWTETPLSPPYLCLREGYPILLLMKYSTCGTFSGCPISPHLNIRK